MTDHNAETVAEMTVTVVEMTAATAELGTRVADLEAQMEDPLNLMYVRTYRDSFGRLLPGVRDGKPDAIREASDLFEQLTEDVIRPLEEEMVRQVSSPNTVDANALVVALAGGLALSVALDVAQGYALPN